MINLAGHRLGTREIEDIIAVHLSVAAVATLVDPAPLLQIQELVGAKRD